MEDSTLEGETEFDLPNRAKQQSPVSLSMLFYLVTVAAIVSACIRFVQSDSKITILQVMVACLICSLVGILLGIVLWLTNVYKLWIAPLMGLALGAALGPLLCIRFTHFSQLIAMSFLGSWILIVIICIRARFSSNRWQSSSPS